jgi:hypothetical protein
MRKLRALWMRFSSLLRQPRGDCDFEAELASHLAMHTDDGIRAGSLPRKPGARRSLPRRLSPGPMTLAGRCSD